MRKLKEFAHFIFSFRITTKLQPPAKALRLGHIFMRKVQVSILDEWMQICLVLVLKRLVLAGV